VHMLFERRQGLLGLLARMESISRGIPNGICSGS